MLINYKRHKKHFFISSLFIFLFLISIDLKNYFMNGDIFITNGDFLDSISSIIEIPGVIISSTIVLIVYSNIHNYNSYVLWVSSIVFNTIFYGLIFYFLFPMVLNIIKNKFNAI